MGYAENLAKAMRDTANTIRQKVLEKHMGYRSDVEYTIRFKDEASYRLFILEAKANPETVGCFNDHENHLGEFTCDDERWRIDFETSGVKWYDSFPAVQMHEKLIAQAQAWCDDDTHKAVKDGGTGHDAYRLGYVLVRIGEDDDDVNRQSGGNSDYDWLYVSRSIESGSR